MKFKSIISRLILSAVFFVAGLGIIVAAEKSKTAVKEEKSQTSVKEEVSSAVEGVKTEVMGQVKQAGYFGASILRGQQVYNNACAGCHGRAGDGNGVAGQYIDPPPRNFTKGIFRFRSTPGGELPTDEDLYTSITDGMLYTMMPAYKELLTEQETWDVVNYVKTFCPDFQEYGSGKSIDIPEETKKTAKSIEEGKYVYMVQGCWTCHGIGGRGDGPSGATQEDDEERQLENGQ
jgi:mono/diheme cytochrome c family protein